jgi:putative hydrolase of the HAD superfamily
VFDLFHTLVDPEPLRPAGFDRLGTVASVCGLDRAGLAEFWSATYVERETKPIDLLDLIQRHAATCGIVLTDHQGAALDRVFGAAEDAAILEPDDRLVGLVARLAEEMPVGVLSNCHEHEIRRWPDSPFAPHVTVFGGSCRIGAMKPDREAYTWIIDELGADPATSIYVGNGGSDELAGAREAGFGAVIHCNVSDRLHGAVRPDEQRRRAEQADESVDTIDELVDLLSRFCGDSLTDVTDGV